MIYLMGLSAAFMMTFLPFWTLPIFCFAVGFARRYDWCRALTFAMIAAIIVIGAALFKDFQAHNIISTRLAGLLHIPSYIVALIPGFLIIWIGVFFARLGGSLRGSFVRNKLRLF